MSNKQLKILILNFVIFVFLIIGIVVYKADSANLKYIPPFGTDVTQNTIQLNKIDEVTLSKDQQVNITKSINNYFIKYVNNTNYNYSVDPESIYQTIPDENGIEVITFNIYSLDKKETYSVKIESSNNNWMRTTVQQVDTNNILTTFRSLN